MRTQKKVEEIEQKYEVNSVRVRRFGKTFEIYPWIKGRLFHKFITGSETMQERNFRLYWRQFTSIFYGVHNLFRSYDIWAFSSSAERRGVDGVYYDKVMDFIGNNLGFKTLVIELRLFQYIPYRKIASRYAVSRSFFLLFEMLYTKLFLRKVTIENEDLLEKVISEVGDGVNTRALVQKYLAQYRLMRFWLRLFKKPKMVFLTVSYTNFGYIRAFKEAGIKVVEMQHGVISKNHHAYYYKAHPDAIQFPDVLATVGEKEVEVFDDLNGFPIREVVPLGSWIIDHYSTKNKSIVGSEKKILFTLQDGVMSDLLLPFIIELHQKVPEGYKIIVQPRRVHKATYLIKYPEVKNIEFSKQHFYEAIEEAHVHATIYSTTAIESLSFGVPNILVNLQNQSVEQLGNILKDNPFTQFVDSVDTFLAALTTMKTAERQEIAESNSYNIKEGYKQNARSFVNKLMTE